MKIENLYINQKITFKSSRKLLQGKIIMIGYFRDRDDDGKDYHCEVEVNRSDDYNGIYQLRIEEIK